MRVWRTMAFAAMITFGAATSAVAQEDGVDDRASEVSLVAELGVNAPVYHTVQFGEDGTSFDYVEEGGQGVLFSFERFSVEAVLGDRHRVIFLWQPLAIETDVRMRRDVVVDGATFEEGTPVRLTYRFPFYRASYLFDLVDRERTEFSIGGSLQLRNATIAFASADGELRRERRNVGPVPILKFRYRHETESGWWYGAEADGFYAPIRYLNLSDSDVIGWIVDASARFGRRVTDDVALFLNARYLGGGADGTSNGDAEVTPSDGYTRNVLNFVTLSLGFEYRFR